MAIGSSPRRGWWRLKVAALALTLCASIGPSLRGRIAGAEARHVIAAPHTAMVRKEMSPGFKHYSSRILPYTIDYPAGWTASGSIFGGMNRPAGVYYYADSFFRKQVGTIEVMAEGLPPGSRLSSSAYAEVLLLDLQRAEEGDSTLPYTATRLGTLMVNGVEATMLDVVRGTGSEQLHTTEAIFVAAHRGWRIALTTVVSGPVRTVLLPSFTQMVQSFRVR